MAADLTLLRSRLLVPTDAAAAQDAYDEAERLRQRLLGRAQIGRAADWLEGRGQLGRDVFGRGQPDGAGVVWAGEPAISPPCYGRAWRPSDCHRKRMGCFGYRGSVLHGSAAEILNLMQRYRRVMHPDEEG